MLVARSVPVALAVLCISPISAARWAMAEERDSARCGVSGSALQILGSGGPMHGQGSAAYLIWANGQPRIVVHNGGGGTTPAPARAGVEPAQRDALLISHVHLDHVSDLAEFLWGEMLANGKSELVIAGPAGDYLVLHAMLTPRASPRRLAQVAAPPENLGRRVAEAKAKRVVLDHLMSGLSLQEDAAVWSLSVIPAVIAGARAFYRGPIFEATDLQCLQLTDPR